MTSVSTDTDDHSRIERRTPSRTEFEALASARAPVLLVDCDLEAADLSNLDMADWRFEGCVLKQANLTGAMLENAVFVGCRGAFANFTAARLTEARFQSCDFNNGNFAGATLTQASFTGCKLTGADLGRSKCTATAFSETTLSAARLPGFSVPQGQAGAGGFQLRRPHQMRFSRCGVRGFEPA